MTNNDSRPQDDAAAAEAELAGVPEALIDREDIATSGEDPIALLRGDLEAAKQETLYAKAETQNVRRRLEKDITDARAYAATGFARYSVGIGQPDPRAGSDPGGIA